MKQITLREFSRYFSRYKGEQVAVTDRGNVVGHWKPKVSDKERIMKAAIRGANEDQRKVVEKVDGAKVKVLEIKERKHGNSLKTEKFRPMFKDPKINKQF